MNAIQPGIVKSINTPTEQQQKKTNFLGTVNLHPGHKVFELSLKTLEITEAQPESKTVTFAGAKKSKLKVKDGHIYCAALNYVNAEKRFIRMLNNVVKN